MGPAWATLLLVLVVGLAWQDVRAAHQEVHNPLERVNVAGTVIRADNAVKMAVNTTQLSHGRGEWVEVSWEGVPHPSYADWIGLLVPAGSDPTETAPAKYMMAAQDVDRTHSTQGKGRLRFRLISHRVPVQFGFFRGGLMHPVLAARSPAIAPANPNEPLQRRLLLTGDNTQMRVEWTTKDSGSPVAKWGTRPGHYTQSTAASSTTYTVQDMCGPPANSTGWVEPGTFHSAVLTGLQPGARYYYAVGDEEWGFAPEASFRAAPPVGPGTTVKLIALADLGQAEEDGSMEESEIAHSSLSTTGHILSELRGRAGHQLLVHNGDISYARGYATQWDNFHHQAEPIISTLPYMAIPGNHERCWPNSGDRFKEVGVMDSGGECGVPVERRFTMPQAGPDKPWYSFDFGPIHFLQYSTEHDFAPGSEQHTFMLADLAKVDRTVTPWLVVGGHRPIYISSTNTLPNDGDQVVASDLRQAFEDAFVKFKVDLTLHGHHHSYQRTCPVAAGKCQGPLPSLSSSDGSSGGSVVRGGGSGSTAALYKDAAAPIHLVIGNAGADLSLNVEPSPSDIWQTIRLWWGYLRIEASGSQFKCEAVSDLDGSVMDTLTLVKSEGWAERHMQAMQQQQHGKVRLCWQRWRQVWGCLSQE